MKIYQINPIDNKIIAVFNKVSEIPNHDKHIYRVITGEQKTFKDGYIYRKQKDVIIDNENPGTISVDKLQEAKQTEHSEKLYQKYKVPIELLRNNQDYTFKQIIELSKQLGITISEPTLRKLKNMYN